MRRRTRLAVLAVAAAALGVPASAGATGGGDLWKVYDQTLAGALHRPDAHDHAEHAGVEGLRPRDVPARRRTRRRARPYTYAKDGFEATAYELATDQFGTQFDPPAHWAPE